MIRNTTEIERHLMKLLAYAQEDYARMPGEYAQGKRDGIKAALEGVKVFLRNAPAPGRYEAEGPSPDPDVIR